MSHAYPKSFNLILTYIIGFSGARLPATAPWHALYTFEQGWDWPGAALGTAALPVRSPPTKEIKMPTTLPDPTEPGTMPPPIPDMPDIPVPEPEPDVPAPVPSPDAEGGPAGNPAPAI
jgi:hypothetical protein